MPDAFGPYNELIAGRAPGGAGFTTEGGGRAIHKVLVGDKGDGVGAITSLNTLHLEIQEILGTTGAFGNPVSPKLFRSTPKAHPVYPWLYAERISECVGLGRPTRTTTREVAGIDSFDTFALYPTYELTVEFAPRNYALARNEDIATGTLTWNKPDGSTATKSYAAEWYRYTDFERVPAAEWITAEAGQFQFDVANGVDPDKRKAGMGQLKMIISQTAYKVTWYQVPYSFVDTVGSESYIEQGMGHVNQYLWYGQAAGTLLFVAANITRYTPPVPVFRRWLDTNVMAGEKFCNIQFMFLRRNPTLGKDASTPTPLTATPRAPVNANAIQAGHNYFPLAATHSHYYAKTTGVAGFTDANDRPAFPSFPYELLWSNPAAA